MKSVRSAREKHQRRFNTVYNIYGFLVFAFLYIPVIVMIVFSFNDSRNNTIWQGFTFKWYAKLMSDTELWTVLGNTLIIGLVSTIAAVIIGTVGAVGLSKIEFKGKSIITTALYIPIIIPEIVLAVATLLVIKKVDIGLGMAAMILGNTTLVMPYVFITVKSRLAGMDPSITEASLDLGANRFYTFLHITVPMIMPGIISGGFMAFTIAFDDLIMCNFLANATTVTLPIMVYSQIRRGISPEINAMSTLILLAFLIVVGTYVLAATVSAARDAKKIKKEIMKEKDEERTSLAFNAEG